MTSVGRFSFSTTCATVKVLPLPVTPSRTWCFAPATAPSASASIACGWSPCGVNGDCRRNVPSRRIGGDHSSGGRLLTELQNDGGCDARGAHPLLRRRHDQV